MKCTPSTVLQVLKQRVSREMRKRRHKRVAGQLRFQFGGEDLLPAVLAAAILRFQCMESEEEKREIAIHASESSGAWIGGVGQRLGLELLLVVRGPE